MDSDRRETLSHSDTISKRTNITERSRPIKKKAVPVVDNPEGRIKEMREKVYAKFLAYFNTLDHSTILNALKAIHFMESLIPAQGVDYDSEEESGSSDDSDIDSDTGSTNGRETEKDTDTLFRCWNITFSSNLEKSVYNYTLEQSGGNSVSEYKKYMHFKNMYFHRYLNLYQAIVSPDRENPQTPLFYRLIHKLLTFEKLERIAAREFCPERWAHLYKQIHESKKELHLLESAQITGLFKCGKCKTYQTSHKQYQSRSADEPSTVKVFCHNCNHIWKFN